jgi:hypothetical protein
MACLALRPIVRPTVIHGPSTVRACRCWPVHGPCGVVYGVVDGEKLKEWQGN